MISSFEAYRIYLSLYQHFYSNFDYFKYKGKTRVSFETFEKRKDKYFFDKLAKKRDPLGFVLANIVYRDCKWIGDLFGENGEQTYIEQQKIIQSLSYIFSEEIKKVSLDKDKIKIIDGQHPKLLIDFLQKKISIETLIILDDIIGFSRIWNKKILDTIVWPTILKKMKSYQPFLNYKKELFENILIDFLKKE